MPAFLWVVQVSGGNGGPWWPWFLAGLALGGAIVAVVSRR